VWELMKRYQRLIGMVVAGATFYAAGQRPTTSQSDISTTVEKAGRKLIYRVNPVYPQDLKRFYIGGTVRLKVLVSPRGTVESVVPLGGNPALVDTSIAAVKQWKYTPADGTTEVTLSLVFNPRY